MNALPSDIDSLIAAVDTAADKDDQNPHGGTADLSSCSSGLLAVAKRVDRESDMEVAIRCGTFSTIFEILRAAKARLECAE